MRSPELQRGWVGIIVLLLALVIVAVLSQTVLKQYGLLGGFDRHSQSARPDDATHGPAMIAPAPLDATTATPVPANALERARALESAVLQDAQDRGKQIDDAAK